MTQKLDTLQAALEAVLGPDLKSLERRLGEITVTVPAGRYAAVMLTLRDDPALKFEQLLDLCGVDYSDYKNQPWDGLRYAVVSHLLSITHNWRVRVKVFAPDDDLPAVASVTEIWGSANWFEREAFDLFGLIFEGHIDLRRILTDYGFIGHPMRKDFPVTGNVEMRYDAEKRRVIYQPVSIEPREVVPRVVREDNYGGLTH
ncbi:MAG: NADH-quinone oxidoreductase subunit C [Rubrivivax sp.]|nr:NADH-quinone oxidoreductase subunit C [Rubrivivax sp.]